MSEIVVKVSYACNLACSYCPTLNMGHLPVNKVKVLETLAKLGSADSLSISGGEPLLEFDFVKKIVEQSTSNRTLLITNGLLLTEEIVSYINEHNLYVILSVQGINGEKSLSEPMRNAAWISLVKKIKNLTISYVIINKTIFISDDILALRKTFECDVQVSLNTEEPCTDETLDRLSFSLRDIYTKDSRSNKWITFTRLTTSCDYNAAFVDPTGDVTYPCKSVPGFSGCIGYLKHAMSLSQYYKFVDIVDKFNKGYHDHGIRSTIQILTNLTCNLDCTYCYEKKTKTVNDFETIKVYMRAKFKELDSHEVIIDLIGGESFLYPELCENIIQYALELAATHKKHIIVSTTTNGTTLKNPAVRALIEKHKNLLNIGISVDGTKENHNKCRIYRGGKGSYDDAVEYVPWLLNLMPDRVTTKATFTIETFLNSYAPGMINLMELGFTEIGGNIVFEEIIPKALAPELLEKFKDVIDYIFYHNLERKVVIYQFGTYEQISNYVPRHSPEDANRSWCGTSKYMSCLGLDGDVYGCNRFCTMDKPGMHLGVIKNGEIEITNKPLINEVANFKSTWEGDCKDCILRRECPSCVAATYEVEDKEAYVRENRMCGWTYATAFAKLYFRHKIAEKDEQIKQAMKNS